MIVCFLFGLIFMYYITSKIQGDWNYELLSRDWFAWLALWVVGV